MRVASLELSKTLYEVSGWDDTAFEHIWNDTEQALEYAYHEIIRCYPHKHCPAYDLGYLLRKLPRHLTIKSNIYHLCIINGNANDDNWIADYVTIGRECWLHEGYKAKLTEAENIEDAACKLAIELFKQNILKRGESCLKSLK